MMGLLIGCAIVVVVILLSIVLAPLLDGSHGSRGGMP